MADHPSMPPPWTDHLVRFLSGDGAGTEEAIRAAGERFSYANGTSQRTVMWHERSGLYTVSIETAPDALLTITDALIPTSNGGLDAITQGHLTRLARHRARYQPVQVSIDLSGERATWNGKNHFPNSGTPTYDAFAAIITEGIGALDKRSLTALSSDWRPRTWHLEPDVARYTKPSRFLQS